MKPNWKNPQDYEFIEELTPAALAFEFLRRNPEYVKNHERYSAIKEQLTELYGADKDLWRDDPIAWIYEPPRNPGESLNDWRHRSISEGHDPTNTWFEDWYRKKWGITSERFPSPNEPLKEPLDFDLSYEFPLLPNFLEVSTFFYGDWEGPSNWEPYGQKPHTAVMVFDIEAPLTDQLERAKMKLSHLQSNHKKDGGVVLSLHKPGYFLTKLKTYLRLLDADACQAENKEIAENLFGEELPMAGIDFHAKKVYDTRRSALSYRDLKFRAIAFWPAPSE